MASACRIRTGGSRIPRQPRETAALVEAQTGPVTRSSLHGPVRDALIQRLTRFTTFRARMCRSRGTPLLLHHNTASRSAVL